jgi:DNA-binding transcriptional ArsR family regulator
MNMETQLDSLYASLAHPIRRGILDLLRHGPLLVSELAAHFNVSAPAITKHLHVLENTHLIMRKKVGRRQHIYLNGSTLLPAAEYLNRYQQHWDERLVALDRHVRSKEV